MKTEGLINQKRILIFEVNWLGDVLLTTPSIRVIRKNFPESYIACLVTPRAKEILEDNPYIDELILFDEKTLHKSFLRKLSFIKEVKRKRFDRVFLFHRSFTRTLLCFLAGIKERIGFYTKKRGWLLTHAIRPSFNLHRMDYFLYLLETVGLKIEKKGNLDFFIPESADIYIQQFLNENKIVNNDFLVVINPAGNWSLKRWPKENFAQLIERLVSDYKAKIILSTSKRDKPLLTQIANLSKNKVILNSDFNLKELGALFKRANLVISNDSAPMHIAVVVGAKLIALFGPTSPKITGPSDLSNAFVIQKDVGCSIPCYKLDCNDNRCMKAISVEDVIEKVRLIKVK